MDLVMVEQLLIRASTRKITEKSFIQGVQS